MHFRRWGPVSIFLIASATAASPLPSPQAPEVLVTNERDGGARRIGLPMAVAANSSHVFVADFGGDCIQVFTHDGRFVRRWGNAGTAHGEFDGPAGIALDDAGAVYVTDLGNRRVQKFAGDGSFVTSWSSAGEGTPLQGPLGIAADGRGSVYVTDLDGNRVLQFSEDGTLRAAWGQRGHGPGALEDPWGIAVDASGHVYVADHGNNRVQEFAPGGVFVRSWGGSGVAADGLFGPTGVAVAHDGTVYVSDVAGSHIRRFTAGGRLVAEWSGSSTDDVRPLPLPGLALDPAGGILAADANQCRVLRITDASFDARAVAAPHHFAIKPASPNPSAGAVTLHFTLPVAGTLEVEVYGVDGRRVRRLPPVVFAAGAQRVTWDARADDHRAVPTGVYFVRFQFDDGDHREYRHGRVVVTR